MKPAIKKPTGSCACTAHDTCKPCRTAVVRANARKMLTLQPWPPDFEAELKRIAEGK
jgi:hypothetical protein